MSYTFHSLASWFSLQSSFSHRPHTSSKTCPTRKSSWSLLCTNLSFRLSVSRHSYVATSQEEMELTRRCWGLGCSTPSHALLIVFASHVSGEAGASVSQPKKLDRYAFWPLHLVPFVSQIVSQYKYNTVNFYLSHTARPLSTNFVQPGPSKSYTNM